MRSATALEIILQSAAVEHFNISLQELQCHKAYNGNEMQTFD